MSRLLIGVAALALLTFSTGFADGKSGSAGPTVRIVQTSPLVVAGQRFRPVERIVIRVYVPSATRTRTMRTTRQGTFVASFSSVSVHRCNGGVSVVVTTASGLVAKSKMPQPLCPLPQRPS
jgi:hypothetical protein